MICHCNHVPICAECGGKVPVRKVAPRKSLPGESIKGKRDRKRRTHREETAEIREAVFKRAEGRCEFYLPGMNMRCFAPAHEMHHTKGGNGRRRQQQSADNCVALCVEHHRLAHRASRRSAP